MSRCYVSVVLVAVVTSIIGAPSGCAPTVPEATLVIQHINRASPHTGTDEIERSWREARKKGKNTKASLVIVLRGDPTKAHDGCKRLERLSHGVYEADGTFDTAVQPLYRFAILYPPAGAPLKVVYRDLRALGGAPIYVVLDRVSNDLQRVRRVKGRIPFPSSHGGHGGQACNGIRN